MKDPELSTFTALLASGADPRMTDYEGQTVLHHFAKTFVFREDEKEKIARLLMENGVNPAARDHSGKTAIELLRIGGWYWHLKISTVLEKVGREMGLL
jgi:hypothetical protein